MTSLDNKLLPQAQCLLQQRLPPQWELRVQNQGGATYWEIQAPEGQLGQLRVQTYAQLTPSQLRGVEAEMVAVRYASSSLQAACRERGVGYVDLTGNVGVQLRSPGLWVYTQGASKDPNPPSSQRSLKGPKAGRVVRVLCERGGLGIRALADEARVDAGYVSRLVTWLGQEGLLELGNRNRIEFVRWPALLERWAQQAPLRSRAVSSMCLEPRGLEVLVSKLSQGLTEAVVTGSLAAQSWAPLAGARLAQVYVPDFARAREVLGLREVERGANVMLLEPHDPSALWGSTRAESGLRVAAVCQVVADLWSGPGRGPQEAQALLQWMAEHEAQWRNLDRSPAQEP